MRGFGLRVFPSGRKVFILFYRAKGRQRLATLGTYGGLTVEAARRKASHAATSCPASAGTRCTSCSPRGRRPPAPRHARRPPSQASRAVALLSKMMTLAQSLGTPPGRTRHRRPRRRASDSAYSVPGSVSAPEPGWRRRGLGFCSWSYSGASGLEVTGASGTRGGFDRGAGPESVDSAAVYLYSRYWKNTSTVWSTCCRGRSVVPHALPAKRR